MRKSSELRRFEIEFLRKEKPNIARNFRIVEALYKEALTLGAIPLKNPLDGIEVDLRIAKVVNSIGNRPQACSILGKRGPGICWHWRKRQGA